MINNNFNNEELLEQLERELNKIFSSDLFIKEEKESKSNSKKLKKLDIKTIKPLLKKLGE